MKRIFFGCVLLAATHTSHGQTLISYGNNTISKEEFLRAFNKNKTPVASKEKAVREYLELYTNFKLKVKAASERRYDTLPHIKADVNNFRGQVQDNYLADEQAITALYNEAFDRSRTDVHALLFSVPVLAGTSPVDSAKAFKAIQQIHADLQLGKTDYQQLVESVSPVATAKFSDLGFITAFTLPYTYENIVYGLKPGQTSKPFRAKNAWYVFKVLAERPAAGKWKVAQILFSIPPGADDAAKKALQQKADSVYNALQSGADFAMTAQKFSDDKLTYQMGGELAEFGTGKFDQSFEKEVFNLKADGDITKPFITPYGIHIVKRLGNTLIPADRTDPATQFELKQKIQKDNRIETPRNRFAKSIMAKIGMKKLAVVRDVDLFRYADSVLANVDLPEGFPISKKPVLQFNKKTVNASDWLTFVQNYKGNPEMYKGENNKELWEKYMMFAAMEYYKAHMEDYNVEFRYQMKEFEEGNMLFEIMEKNIWGKAAEDSIGLMKYYALNKTKYRWAPSADVLIFNCSTTASAEEAFESLQKDINWKTIAENHSGNVQIDSGRYELTQIIGTDFVQSPASNSYSPLVKNSDGTAAFVKYITVYPGNEQRDFNEAKGLVINDYQAILEEAWIKELRKKYPVKINEAVLQSLLK